MTDKDQVIQALRATLISVKGALTLKQCNRDYRELQGEWIPFKKLGYPSLEKLFLDVPGFKVTQINGEWYVDAIASQETQHIASMVSRQKSSKKTSLRHVPPRFPKKQGSWRKPAPPTYATSYNNQYSSQYYRVRDGTSFNNNNNKYAYKSKPFENRASQPESTEAANQPARQLHENNEKYKTNSVAKSYTTSTSISEGHSVLEESKHSVRSEGTESKSGKVSASQRLSNLRDRLNTVDIIPLQLPAVSNVTVDSNSLVTNVTPARSLEPPPESSSSVVKLEWTCRKLGLPAPVYKVHDIAPKRGPVSYDCTCKVGTTYTASSYPDSSPSEELAKEVAAVKLLALIESAEAGDLPTSSNTKAMVCLADLVAEHEAGIWVNDVPRLYRLKYNENLPCNWQELVENCPKIVKDQVANGLSVLLPNEKDSFVPVMTTMAPLDDPIESELPPLQFPDEDFWNVFVTVANSTLEIWLRIIGPEYSGSLETLLADMGSYYERGGTLVDRTMLINDAWYAVNLDDGGWQRAKILEIKDETAIVFLGDHGDDDSVQLDRIKILEPQFRQLPAQAILCRLEGLEELAASAIAATLVRRRLPGETLVAAPGPRTDPADPSVALVLYDTSTQRDLNLNKEIVHDFCIAGAFTVTQKPCEVKVGYVTDEGRLWVSRAGGAEEVQGALSLLTGGAHRRPLPSAPPAPPTNPHTLYIVRTCAGDWVRCTVISGLDAEGTVRTQLVDSGHILRAPLSSLVPLATFSPVLNAYPHQAIQVRLGGAEHVASRMKPRVVELVRNACVLCRALSAPPAPPASPGAPPAPAVELFVRTGPQNILASVNNAILMEFDYLNQSKEKEDGSEKSIKPSNEKSVDPVEALNKKKERIFRSTSLGQGAGGEGGGKAVGSAAGVLPPPPLPSPGQCFDVYVAMAANPWNFVVQPNSTRHTLQLMMKSLQEECPKLSESDIPVNPASGELYTVYYEKDASWYRVTIAGTVSTEMVSVYFCDYGDLALFTIKSLRVVPPGAPLARTLPPQAIKARLYDVWPLHQDWTVEDCIRFQELCVEQEFVGICKDVGKDPLNPSEPLLTLDLIDTSTEEDIYLNKQLVVEGRARLASASQNASSV